MATNVILPALGMAQDTGKIVRWLKAEGEQVKQGEPLVEIETDKATVEIEALASGVLTHVVAREGDDVPVGQVIATILAPDETGAKNEIPAKAMPAPAVSPEPSAKEISSASQPLLNGATASNQPMTVIAASPL